MSKTFRAPVPETERQVKDHKDSGRIRANERTILRNGDFDLLPEFLPNR